LAYDLLVNGTGETVVNFPEAIRAQYGKGVTDEFLKPMRSADFEKNGAISAGDVVVCFNFRTDRCREITQVLTQMNLPDFQMKKLDLHYVTMTRYDESYKGVQVIFEKDDVRMTLGEVLEKAGKTQLRIAETEKYPHVTFFFSGGREEPFVGEKRIMIPSPKVATYDLQPEMSAYEVTEAILSELKENPPDFVCLNFANCDMVGHTGVMKAAVKAAEVVDECTGRVVEAALSHNFACLIIADHGNADQMANEDGTPNTAHTKNPVPCLLLKKGMNNKFAKLDPGTLADIAPTILDLMSIPQPEEMTGKSLLTVF
jgi:2,3-bisphosphoglycerate-independent phosphoglycerate mutase